MTASQILDELRGIASERNREGMARFGINIDRALGVSVTTLRKLSRRCGKSHAFAAELWASEIHEARILASIVDIPSQVTPGQMDRWICGFNSWDLCDQCCLNLFDKTPYAWTKIPIWARRKAEFEKRAAFSLIAALAWHDRVAPNECFLALLPLIECHAGDDRNFVRKAVNWALRQIGKRNPELRGAAISCAQRIRQQGSRSARWIAHDALRDLDRQATNSG